MLTQPLAPSKFGGLSAVCILIEKWDAQTTSCYGGEIARHLASPASLPLPPSDPPRLALTQELVKLKGTLRPLCGSSSRHFPPRTNTPCGLGISSSTGPEWDSQQLLTAWGCLASLHWQTCPSWLSQRQFPCLQLRT